MTYRSDNQIASVSAVAPVAAGMAARRRRGQAGIALIQVIMAMGVIAVCGATGIQALAAVNRKAAAMRTINQARAIVQRNIDTALGAAFDKTQTPAILAFTTASGSVYDDDGNSDNQENVLMGRAGTTALVKGTLTRIVLAEANSDNADIRRVTFQLNYTFGNKPYTFAMTTLRAMD